MAPPKKGLKELEALFPSGPERIQKLLARAGFGSRRKCEDIISAGRVRVDGETVKELGAKACPETQEIEVDGKLIKPEDKVYYLLNKPKGVLCTVDDPLERKTVLSFFPEETRRIFPVGRLDLDSRGAVILTNDGRLTQLLTHPRYGVDRTYTVRVRGVVDDYSLNRLRSGIQLSEGRTSPAKVWVAKRRDDETELGVSIHEGRNRQVRRMFAAVDHKVRGLTRTRIGCLTIKGLASGEARRLTSKELRDLVKAAKESEQNTPQHQKNHKRRGGGPKPKRHGKPDPKLAHDLHIERERRQKEYAKQFEDATPITEAPSFGSEPEVNSVYKRREPRSNSGPERRESAYSGNGASTGASGNRSQGRRSSPGRGGVPSRRRRGAGQDGSNGAARSGGTGRGRSNSPNRRRRGPASETTEGGQGRRGRSRNNQGSSGGRSQGRNSQGKRVQDSTRRRGRR